MTDLPSGTVTFLFTDLEGSTRLWEEHPDAMQDALARHDELLRDAIEANGGHVVKFTGDGFHAAFATAHDAIAAAVAAQTALVVESWGTTGPLRVRIGVHTGEAQHRDGDYHGTALNRAARLTAVAHGGQIVVSAVTEALVSDALPEDVQLHDLGEHRLRDLAQPLRVFEVQHPELPQQFPPLRSLDTYPSNLPVQLSSFIGRDDDLTAVARAFDESRVVTVTGVGGVGKTRLATHAAAHLLPRYPEGAWFCELAPAIDEESMAQIISAALGAIPRPGLTLAASAVEYLRDRALLLVLDNCEHLLVPASRFAEDVLRSCSGVQVLATSREGLGIEGERVVPLRSLSVPDEHAAFTDAAASSAVRLFSERAGAVDPQFVLDLRSLPAVAEICRRLDGMPLAIELAAARVATMSATEIARRLDERFRLLTGGRRTAVERHQTLRATIDWSYSLLDAREQLVFDRLAVFAGSFDADAAVAVTSGGGVEEWDVLDALSMLVSKSMVDAERPLGGMTRYSLLETLRQYARERLEETAEADSWRRRHAEHYAALCETIGGGLVGPEELVWHTRLVEELDNLRAAVTWSLDSAHQVDGELALRVITALGYQCIFQRRYGVDSWAERARPRVGQTTPGRRTVVLAAASQCATSLGDPGRGRALALEAVRDGVPADCPYPAMPFIALSVAEALLGDTDSAEEALGADAHATLVGVGASEHDLLMLEIAEALWAAMSGQVSAASASSGLNLARARELGNPSTLVMSLFIAAWGSWEERPAEALDELEESLALARAGATEAVMGVVLGLIAQIRASVGDRAALRILREAGLYARDQSHASVLTVVDRAIRVFSLFRAPSAVAVLAGAVEREPFRSLSIVPSRELPARHSAIADARESLDGEEYQREAARGAAMSYDELVQYLVATVDDLLGAEGRA